MPLVDSAELKADQRLEKFLFPVITWAEFDNQHYKDGNCDRDQT